MLADQELVEDSSIVGAVRIPPTIILNEIFFFLILTGEYRDRIDR